MKRAPRPRPSRSPASGELARLRTRLAELEQALRAIRTGEVDAVVVAGKAGPQVFTLQGANHPYRVLIESMNEGALTLTADKVILYANQCFARMIKCPLEQIVGSSFRRFLSDADRATLRPLLKRAGKSGSKIQVSLRAGDNSKTPVQISIRPLAKKGGDPATVGMVVTDMTEARRAARQQETERLYAQAREHGAELERRVDERTGQLLKANQELEAFQASVSHDLRAPLRHLMGYSQILIETWAPQLPAEARAYLRKILEGAGKMEGMIVALLQFSRLGQQPLSLEPVDVSRMWREIFAEMKPETSGRRIEVTIGELPPCQADPTLLRQVLVNLLGNALKYSRTRELSVIQISASAPPDGGTTTYSIKDNGVGFDMTNAGRLFTVFARLHTHEEFEGAGVGLTTAQRILQRHGGRIWAESAPGVGATFSFVVGPPLSTPANGTALSAVKIARRTRK